ncbi:MAG: hypothetical protein KME59_14420 [Trichormus sp. ATA11-4-KO1]|nr:hypothetical protein [Trichormus sp. ATA11-4-KO1]
MKNIAIGLVLGVLLSSIGAKFLIGTPLFKTAYCNWDAVERLFVNSKYR